MDEKGFAIGVTTRSKRIVTKSIWASKQHEDVLPPAIIFSGKAGLRSGWINDAILQQHEVFLSNSVTGWTNNELGIAWLEQVFDRSTKAKARRQWRLLILDGHGSHVTSDFINYCDNNKILLAIFPPHATHSLQPLDVVLFGPLGANYSRELDRYLQRSQALIGVKKGDFLPIFWPAWSSTMRPDVIKQSFRATGIWPMEAEVILKRFNNNTSEQDKALQISEHRDGDS
ncbi:hypothetical protein PTT_13837 [Pyrenophora teres f. teres 0-1]|uniref:DDE-1 domain-containing protein n=1 Tax=Pyrenophora teres f. teres (strain 0-1) TaxID=861557 RepID=E3RWY0_PYRTT|nr:hypothetical protein PTT_13837 [Pyrenophora teres f. teres 0-1]